MARFYISPLGAPTYTASRLAKEFTAYLTDSAAQDQQLISGVSSSLVDYYDEAEQQSVSASIEPYWQGTGLARLGLAAGQRVHPYDLQVLLGGRSPVTGERIITAQGSHGRRHLKVGKPTLILRESETDRACA